jgi:hypothetical protein
MTRIDRPRDDGNERQTRRKVKPPSDEHVILSLPGVHITPVRAVIGDQLFAVANITSVTVVKQNPSTTIPITVALFGLIIGFCGIVGFLPMLEPGARANAQTALQSMSCTIAGAVLLMIGWYAHRTGKSKYVLVLRAGGGEAQVYSSADKAIIEAITRALNDAIMARG